VEIIEKAIQEGRDTLSEHESKELLKAYGIPVTREAAVSTEGELMEAVREIGFPLVLKGCSAALSHKTERGMVRLDIRNEQEAQQAFEELREALQDPDGSILVQEMVQGRRELVLGMTRDPQFGPCVMFGLGGIFTEILKDVSFRVAPIEERDALEMMREIKGHKILDAVRGMPPADLKALAAMLMALGKIGLDHDAVKEIDCNPVILSGSRPVAADALVVLNKG